MDVKSMTTHFDFSNIESIYEKKNILLSKLKLVDERLLGEQTQNLSYKQMLEKLHKENQEDTKKQIDLHEQKMHINQVVEEISHIN